MGIFINLIRRLKNKSLLEMMLPIWEFLFSLKKVKSIVLFVLYDRVSRAEIIILFSYKEGMAQ